VGRAQAIGRWLRALERYLPNVSLLSPPGVKDIVIRREGHPCVSAAYGGVNID